MKKIILPLFLSALLSPAFSQDFGSFSIPDNLNIPVPVMDADKGAPRVPEIPCYSSKAGCATVSGFYMIKKWVLKYGGDCVDITSGRGILEACKDIKANYPGSHPTAEKDAVCDAVHDKIQPSWMYKRPAIEMSRSICKSMWFDDRIEIEFEKSGRISSDGEIVRVTAKKEAGNGDYKSYKGSAQNIFNMDIEITCSRNANEWKNDTLSIRIDKPQSVSQSGNFSFSVGPSVAKFGGGYSYGVTHTYPYGVWQKLDIKGVFCGSDIDQKDK
ncbi:MAG: hypothetical protein GX447_09470 [Elusimicrobia bacterium]|nr:hypothetical protein [Elusimicrobiota bacterium]